MDPIGRFVEPQPAWARYTGQSFERSRDFGWFDAVHPDDRAAARAAWVEALHARKPYEVRVRLHGFDRILIVRRPIVKRVSAEVAATAAEDRTPPPPPREAVPTVAVRERGAGRPTKRERRDLDRLRGR